jgi:tetratricopeptide (TPR) repeat protein
MELDDDVLADVLLAAWQDSADGDDRNGYRLRLVIPNQNLTVIVVKENGQYRVLGGSNSADLTSEYIGYEVLARVEQGRLPEARRLLDWVREEVSPAGGDDPLGGPLLPRFWRKGQPGNSAEIRQAAAVLLAGKKAPAADAIRLLEPVFENAVDEAERERLTLALAVACLSTKQYTHLLQKAAALARSHPDSETAFYLMSAAIIGLGRWTELEAQTASRLKKDPSDALALRLLLHASLRRIDLEAGRRQEDHLRRAGKLVARDLNELAWLALLAGKVDERALDTIQQAIRQSQANPSAALLHTAASLYAETGKSVEAREVLLQSLDLRGYEEPDPDSWYVFARIAETYGETAAAREMYARVTKPESDLDIPSSTYALAQRRLAALSTSTAQ